MILTKFRMICLAVVLLGACPSFVFSEDFTRLRYNNPELVVDLGVGLYAWPLPMDYDGDGNVDLVVSSPDAIKKTLTFFRNPGGSSKLPVFEAGVHLGTTVPNLQISYVAGKPRILGPNVEYKNFLTQRLANPAPLSLRKNLHENPVRANQWKYVDFEGDGVLDLALGVEDWTDYGWDDAFNETGQWTRGPLHGFVYLLKNTGTNEAPVYARPEKLAAEDGVIDVYGMPSPNFADFDGDGDLDLLCGEFVDRLKYYENIGTRSKPRYAAGRFLPLGDGLLKIDCCMFVPVAIDWDEDGDLDLVIGQEDGRVLFCENRGTLQDGLPLFNEPRFFQQQADEVKLGILCTPTACDWDGDGDEDILAGDGSGRVGWFENLGGTPPRWQQVRYLQADNEEIRIQAGENGSIQGPCEAKWGYSVPCVADWDKDGLPDLMLNSIWGKIVWYRNIGTRAAPRLAAAESVKIAWQGEARYPAWNWWRPADNEFVSQWRSSVQALDLNHDGYLDLVALDDEGFLAAYLRIPSEKELTFEPGQRIFFMKDQQTSAFDQSHRTVFADANGDGLNDLTTRDADGTLPYSHFVHVAGRRLSAFKSQASNRPTTHSPGDSQSSPLRFSVGWAGQSGRRQFCFTDWDGDGQLDLLVNSLNVNFLKNVADEPGQFLFEDKGPIGDLKMAGHTTCPTVVHWHKGGLPDLLVGAEDGYFYYLKNPSQAE